VHRVDNGPLLINDACKSPHHSLQLALDALAKFQAPRKRIVLGAISDASGSDRTYSRAYLAAKAVADQVIFIGEHSHRSKASAEDIATGRFVRFASVKQAADHLKETAIPDEIILVKGASNLHLERLVINFFVPVLCWADACGKSAQCVPMNGRGCGLYGTPFPEHKAARKRLTYPLPPDPYFG
jgi:UDP-N-acetylmuramoyl-tripeptide--D-alanyl-D-alanine ligase